MLKSTQYAKIASNRIVKAQKGIYKNQLFLCPGCDQELYAATEGLKQYPHFRHKSFDGKQGCGNPESYFHWITKELFAEHYKNTTKFELFMNIEQKCIKDEADNLCTKKIIDKIDLKKIYPYISIETVDKENGFRPDCLLYNNNGDKLYIEICYSHAISDEKKRISIPILELFVTDEKHIDIIVKNNFISENNSHILIHNKRLLLQHFKTSFECKDCIVHKAPFSSYGNFKKEYRKKPISESYKKLKEKYKHRQKESSFLWKYEHIQEKKLVDKESINYLSSSIGKIDIYTTETVIPIILAMSKEEYLKNYNKYNSVFHNKYSILNQTDTFIFLYSNEIYYGAIRYESKWHIFILSDKNKISFIVSIENERDLEKTINTFNIF